MVLCGGLPLAPCLLIAGCVFGSCLRMSHWALHCIIYSAQNEGRWKEGEREREGEREEEEEKEEMKREREDGEQRHEKEWEHDRGKRWREREKEWSGGQ